MSKFTYRKNEHFCFLQKAILTEAFIEIGVNSIIVQMAANGLGEYRNELRRNGRQAEIEDIHLDIIETTITPIGNQMLIVLGVAFVSQED